VPNELIETLLTNMLRGTDVIAVLTNAIILRDIGQRISYIHSDRGSEQVATDSHE
jgi:hypothetical protein